MDAQEFRNIQEAYMEVVENQQLDEAKEDEGLTPLQKIRKRNKAYAMPGEPAGQQTSNRRAERSSDRGVKKQRGAKSAFGTMRHIGGPYTGDNYSRYMGKTQEEQYGIYDIILSHLLDEGYAETPEAAEAIMVNMSEEWREGILDESRGADLRAKHGDNPSKKLDAKAFKKAMSYDNRDRLATGQTGTQARSQYLGLSGRAGSRARGETPASSALSPDNKSRKVRKRGGRPKGIGAGENRDRPTG